MAYSKQIYLACSVVAAIGIAVIWWETLQSQWPLPYKLAAGLFCVLIGMHSLLCSDIGTRRPSHSHTVTTFIVQYLFTLMCFLYGKYQYNAFVTATKNCIGIQKQLLRRILQKSASTNYHREYGINELTSREEYVRLHPLTTYEHYHEPFQRIANGEQNVLTTAPISYFATTSGTTGKQKEFPITASYRMHMLKAILMFYSSIGKAAYEDLHRVLLLRLKPKMRYTKAGIPCGPLSHLLSVPPLYSIAPRESYTDMDIQSAYYINTLFALTHNDLGYVEGFMSTLSYSIFQTIQDNPKQLCDDITYGRISELIDLDPTVRENLNKLLYPNPERSAEVAKALKAGNKGLASRLWPKLKLWTMVCTGGFAHHARLLMDSFLHGIPTMSVVHCASEGLFGVALTPTSSPLNMKYTMLQFNVFFEFIAEEDITKPSPRTVFIDQIQKGKRYEIVATTEHGLRRYRVGDVIEIVDFHNQCPIYQFCYRTGQMLNVHTENTPENTLYEALKRTEQQWNNIKLVNYTSTENIVIESQKVPGGDFPTGRYYILFVEAEIENDNCVLNSQETTLIDRNLCAVYEPYNEQRNGGLIDPMRVVQVQRGTFRELKNLLIMNTSPQQFKLPTVIREKSPLTFLLKQQIKDTQSWRL